ncbi:351_t:CDS:2, partial [Rhizophagus irregularis]
KKLNEILESENLNDCAIKDLRTLVENTSKLNEILEGEDSQATSVKANEMLVSEDMSDYIIKDLGSLVYVNNIPEKGPAFPFTL